MSKPERTIAIALFNAEEWQKSFFEWETHHPELKSGEARMLHKMARVAKRDGDELGVLAANYLLYCRIVKPETST